MVGIFSRFSVSRTGHRRTQSALGGREATPPSLEATGDATVTGGASAAAHGIEVAVEFKPLEHPPEPLDKDQPIQCPLPDPSIQNDGQKWKERVSAGVQRRAEMPVMHEGPPVESEPARSKPPRPPSNRLNILPSMSAPEHSILKLLDECNASGN